ncbi:MAG: DNA/RNA nuclease SfsA [bacterium]
MKLAEPLIAGTLRQRYKRFLVDVELPTGPVLTAHCPNSGSMKGLLQTGSPVLLSKSANPKRKLAYTWELVQVKKNWVGVNTLNANRIVHEALTNRQIPELTEFDEIKKEAVWEKNCRFDFRLQNKRQSCFVEVKNVTLAEDGCARFPDARTERGTKHLNHLMKVVAAGHRGVMCFLVQRADCDRFQPAFDLDPVYSETLQSAFQKGVEILVYSTRISPPEIRLAGALEFELLR